MPRLLDVTETIAQALLGEPAEVAKSPDQLERRYHSCAHPFLFMAKGTKRWHVKLRVHNLPAGDYRAVARGVDASQNKERPTHRRNVIRFAVR